MRCDLFPVLSSFFFLSFFLPKTQISPFSLVSDFYSDAYQHGRTGGWWGGVGGVGSGGGREPLLRDFNRLLSVTVSRDWETITRISLRNRVSALPPVAAGASGSP